MGSPMPLAGRVERAWSWITARTPLPEVLLLQQVLPGRFADGWPVAWGHEVGAPTAPQEPARDARAAVAAPPGTVVDPVTIPRPSWARWGGTSSVAAARVHGWTFASIQVGPDESGTRWLRYVIGALADVTGPVVLGGDFNRPVDAVPAASRMFDAARLAGYQFVCGSGEELLPTTERSQTDHLWVRGADPWGTDWAIDASVRSGDDPLSSHAALWLTARPVGAAMRTQTGTGRRRS